MALCKDCYDEVENDHSNTDISTELDQLFTTREFKAIDEYCDRCGRYPAHVFVRTINDQLNNDDMLETRDHLRNSP